MNLKQVDYFLAVSETLNFTTAAKALYISQPALSKQISLLEKELDTQLFIRNNRKISLTKAGAQLQYDLKEVMNQIENAKQRAWRIGQENQDIFRIGCFDGEITSDFLPTVVGTISKISPSTNIDIRRGPFKILRDDLKQGSLDILFTLEFELAELCNYHCRKVAERDACLVFSEKSRLGQKEELSPEDFNGETLLTVSPDISSGGYQNAINSLKQLGITPGAIRRVDEMGALIAYLELAEGFCFLSHQITESRKGLRAYHPPGSKPINVFAVWAEDSPLIQKILEGFKENSSDGEAIAQ